MRIRRADPSDADAIIAFDEIAQRDPSRVVFIRQSIRSNNFVAVSSGQVVGYAVLNYTFYDRGFLAMLYVSQSLRHRGIGSALLSHVEQRCTTATLFTSTNRSNAPMQALLEKCGYRSSGVIENLDEGDAELVDVKRLRSEAG